VAVLAESRRSRGAYAAGLLATRGWTSLTAKSWSRRRSGVTWSPAERDQALTALLERVPQEALAQRVTLQMVLPGLKIWISGIRAWDVEERAAAWWPLLSRSSLGLLSKRQGHHPASGSAFDIDVCLDHWRGHLDRAAFAGSYTALQAVDFETTT